MSSKVKGKIFIFGASGHAKVVIDIIERQGLYDIAFLIDDDPILKGNEVYGYSVLGGKAELVTRRDAVIGGVVAIGSNTARAKVAAWLVEKGFPLVSVIHPSAQIARGCLLGDGTVVMAGAIVNSDTRIGDNVIVNTCASVDHDCIIDNSVHIAPGATLCGAVTIGQGTFVCAGATIIPNLKIGRNVTVGAGSTVLRDVPDGVTVVGCPEKII